MQTPIVDFLEKFNLDNPVRLHMPAHKGKVVGYEKDITEICGADSLFDANGIILQSENNLSSLYNSAFSVYSTEGSSLSIKTTVALVKKYAIAFDKTPLIWAFRNAHRSFVDAVCLCDIKVKWLNNGNNIYSNKVSLIRLENALKKAKTKPTALYITSPDYLGNIAPIKEIKAICEKYSVLLVVDNAHGAYLNFLEENMHPLHLGADICCDSAHKTLPTLTGGAYLHFNKTSNFFTRELVKQTMKIFASTSPSYLILESLDKTNKYLFENKDKFSLTAKKVKLLKRILTKKGYKFIGNEPLKLTIDCNKIGYSAKDIANILMQNNIFVEFFDEDYLVLMFSPLNSESDFDLLKNTLLSLEIKKPIIKNIPILKKHIKKMDIKKAYFSNSELLEVDKCENRILALANISCPPAIPILISGEVITLEAIKVLKYYKIEKCLVVK